MWSVKMPAMKSYPRNVSENAQGMVVAAIAILLIVSTAPALPAQSQEIWNCEETAFYSIYEDISRTESRGTSNSATLKWIDASTIGFVSSSFKRKDLKSGTYFSQSSESSLQIHDTERPYLVVLTQPQVWMNQFGNLRVRFYRCTP